MGKEKDIESDDLFVIDESCIQDEERVMHPDNLSSLSIDKLMDLM